MREQCWFVAVVTGPYAATGLGARTGSSRLVTTTIVVIGVLVIGVGGGVTSVTSVTCFTLVIGIVIVVVVGLI